jgi:hypothetical protein
MQNESMMHVFIHKKPHSVWNGCRAYAYVVSTLHVVSTVIVWWSTWLNICIHYVVSMVYVSRNVVNVTHRYTHAYYAVVFAYNVHSF